MSHYHGAVSGFWDNFVVIDGLPSPSCQALSAVFLAAVDDQGAWERPGGAMRRESETRRTNVSFEAVPAAPWGPCGAFERPLTPFAVLLGDIWLTCS